MKRRQFLKAAAIPVLYSWKGAPVAAGLAGARSRVRPGDAGWPSSAKWDALRRSVAGRLIKLDAPFAGCGTSASGAACVAALARIKNTFAIGDDAALTQTSGWAGAWVSQPSAYAVAAKTTADVVHAVNFARIQNLRLVVKGGGHSYQGTSNSCDSLLLWTRRMNRVDMHAAFVAQGCAGTAAPQPAVTIEAGAMWIDAYNEVTTRGGRYVQGGGCTTVGVAGLVQSGGFGNFSKAYGSAAAGLLEAEVVTADGQVRIANACTNPDLFWALKGGGGGNFGVVTRMTLRTRALPEHFGGIFFTIKAGSDEAFRVLIARMLAFYRDALFNPHWGEQIAFSDGNRLDVSMVFQGLDRERAEAIWRPFLAWLDSGTEYVFEKPFQALAVPARRFWDAAFFSKHAPGLMLSDPRTEAPAHHALWRGDLEQAGWFIHGYKSAWMPASLLQGGQQVLADAIFRCTRHWRVGFHFNKGLAGAPSAEIEAARNTATNPEVLDAFALAIIAGGGDPLFPGMPGAAPDPAKAGESARRIGLAMDALLAAAPGAGAYVSESDYFQSDWRTAFWGGNYPRLAAVKKQYDPEGLFFTHHGIGSDAWSGDGFTRLAG